MKNITTLLLFMIIATSCDNSSKQNSDDVADIKALSAKRAKAFNDGDSQVIADAFTETGLLMAPGAEATTGRKAVREYYQGIFDEFKTTLESGYSDVRVSGDIAYGVGHAKVTLTPHNGGDTIIISTSKYINILERQADGTWLTTHDIWNGNEK